jgi:glycerate dehydrogenase
MKISILDAYTINPGDLSWSPLEKYCTLTCYDRTPDELIIERMQDMDGIFVSKCKITAEIMDACPNLRFIGVTATGYDNVDVEAAKARGIAVANNPAYSTEAVAQHTFSLILELTNHIGSYDSSVKAGDWYSCSDFCYLLDPISLLDGKSLGIIGYGNIGRKVGKIGEAFGMNINIYSVDPKAAQHSDILTLHCPLTDENLGFINSEFISGMKPGAILINTARGALINAADVADALKSGQLSGAGIDVLETEPPIRPNPLIGLDNCIVTPHIAWMPKETRQRVIDMSTDNLESFLKGEQLNRVV